MRAFVFARWRVISQRFLENRIGLAGMGNVPALQADLPRIQWSLHAMETRTLAF